MTFNDPSATYSAYYVPIRDTLLAAANEWGGYFPTSNASIELEVAFTSSASAPLGGGSSETSSYLGKNGELDVFEQSISHEIRTGNDPNGATRDGHLFFKADYLANELWFDPTPTNRGDDAVPIDKTDAYTVMLHELGHALGFNGWRDYTTGALPGNYESNFDQLVTIDGSGTPFFNGTAAMAAYGNRQVPLTYSNIMHLGNGIGTGRPGSDLIGDLMNGVVFYRGQRYNISPLDLAVLQDLGLPILVANNAPTRTGTNTNLAAVSEDTAAPAGNSVSNLFGGVFTDVDGTTIAAGGVALIANGATAAQGSWQVKVGAGTFTDLPTLTDSTAVIVLGAGDLIRFVPALNFSGTPGTLTTRLWDGTGGFTASGSLQNISSSLGGSGAFSDNANEVTLSTSITATTDLLPWHNFAKPFDVSGGLNNLPDDHIVAGDALDVINYLNAFGAGPVPVNAEFGQPFGFLDASGGPNGIGDNFITAGDALDIINFLNAGLGGEGESTASPARASSSNQAPADSMSGDLISLLALDIAEQAVSRRRLRS